MVNYKCFNCEKQISSNSLDKRFVCPNCGSKIFFKPRKHIAKVKTD